MLSEGECRQIVERVLKSSRADEVRISLSQDETSHLRFARNTPSTSGLVYTRTVSVRSAFGTRSGSAQGNQLDGDSLVAVVRRSEEVARRSPEDPEYVEGLPPHANLRQPDARGHGLRAVARCLRMKRLGNLHVSYRLTHGELAFEVQT